MLTTVDILWLYQHLNSQIVKAKYVINLYDIGRLCDVNLTNPSNFQSLEAVDRGSEKQL